MGLCMNFFFNRQVIAVDCLEIKVFSSGTLATLPLLHSFQLFSLLLQCFGGICFKN